jgi:hypothetical protein
MAVFDLLDSSSLLVNFRWMARQASAEQFLDGVGVVQRRTSLVDYPRECSNEFGGGVRDGGRVVGRDSGVIP